MEKRNIFIIGGIIVVVILAVFGFGALISKVSVGDNLGESQARDTVRAIAEKINAKEVNHKADTSWIGSEGSILELPEVNEKYPASVKGTSGNDVVIFSSTEKSNVKANKWLDIMAKEFNAQHKDMSVTIIPVASGIALDYIRTRTFIPDAYTPANALWGEMIKSSGMQMSTISDRMIGNVAGILVKQDAYDKFIAKYQDATFANIIAAVEAGDLTLGHTNPNGSSTGLNILLQELKAFDPDNPLSSEAAKRFGEFSSKIPAISPTTAEMMKVADKGLANAVIMEAQAYTEAQMSGWKFIPVGVRHDSPLYSLDNLEQKKVDVLKAFNSHCQTANAQEQGKQLGFNQYNDYAGAANTYSGNDMFTALKLWKQNKDAYSPVISVFVVDRSGSMDGQPMARMKDALKNSIQYINEDNYIGLVTYSGGNDITIDLPVKQFTAEQQSLFYGAIKEMKASGGTATNSALIVALNMALQKQEEVPGAKIRIIVMSDGQQNEGYGLRDAEELVKGLKVPVYGIGFNAKLDDLQKLADINESYTINADNEDIIYKIKDLFLLEL